MNKLLAALLVAGFASQAQADVRITEWMYSGGSGEFIEFTNLGTSAVDFTGWSYDDDSRTPGVFSLSAFGLVGAGESVIITETEAATFRLDWRLADRQDMDGHARRLAHQPVDHIAARRRLERGQVDPNVEGAFGRGPASHLQHDHENRQ